MIVFPVTATRIYTGHESVTSLTRRPRRLCTRMGPGRLTSTCSRRSPRLHSPRTHPMPTAAPYPISTASPYSPIAITPFTAQSASPKFPSAAVMYAPTVSSQTNTGFSSLPQFSLSACASASDVRRLHHGSALVPGLWRTLTADHSIATARLSDVQVVVRTSALERERGASLLRSSLA